MPASSIGERIAQIRRRRSLTQEELAESAQVSVATITKLEQGQRQSARVSTIHAIARGLGVETGELFGDVQADMRDSRSSLLAVRRILAPSLGGVGDIEPPTLERLRSDVITITQLYHETQLNEALAATPSVIDNALAAVASMSGQQKETATHLLAHAYMILGSLMIQLRQEDLAYEATRRAMGHADEIGDNILRAAGTDYLGWILQRQARFDEAERTVMFIGDDIEPSLRHGTAVQMAVWGRLLTRAASSAARNNKPSASREYLSMARSAAARLGDDQMSYESYWGSFGPTTVASIETENAMVSGDAQYALTLARQVKYAERMRLTTWTRHLLTTAEAQKTTRDYAGSIATLRSVQEIAPQWLGNQRAAHYVVRDLLDATSVRRARATGLTELASLMDVRL